MPTKFEMLMELKKPQLLKLVDDEELDVPSNYSKEDICEEIESCFQKDEIERLVAKYSKVSIEEIEKGKEFEEIVAKWAKKYFKAEEVKTRELVQGYAVRRPYEVDVCVIVKHLGLWRRHIWIECKNLSTTIKRIIPLNLAKKAEDVKNYYESVDKKGKFYFKHLAIASTTKFDQDALRMADDNKIACFYYDGKKFSLQNKPDEDHWSEIVEL